MLAAHAQIERIRAERMLEGIQVQSAQHMKRHDHTAFINSLVDRARGVVDEIVGEVERVFWDGSMLKSARQIKRAVASISDIRERVAPRKRAS